MFFIIGEDLVFRFELKYIEIFGYYVLINLEKGNLVIVD